MTVMDVSRRPARAEIQNCDDVDELLDIRDDALDVVEDIDRQLAADQTLPHPDERWASTAKHARRSHLTIARAAVARLIAIAPEAVGVEQPPAPDVMPEPAPPAPKKSDQTATIERLTRENEKLRAQVAHQATQLAALQPAALAAKEARKAAADQRALAVERVFVDQARALLPADTFAAIFREAMARSAPATPIQQAAE